MNTNTMKIVGHIIIKYDLLVEKLGKPNLQNGWILPSCRVTHDMSTPLDKNRAWKVEGVNRNALVNLGNIFGKSDRIIY